MPVTFTTALPDVTTDSITPLDASTEDELGVPQPGVLDNGEYRVEYRITDDAGSDVASGETVTYRDGEIIDSPWEIEGTAVVTGDVSVIGPEEWTLVGTFAWDDSAGIDITSLYDGEQYDVRVRSQTEDVTGAYASVTDLTILPMPGSVATANVGTNSLDVTWTDTADNEDGIRVERRRQYSGGFGPYSEVADRPPNSTSYSDSAVVPGTTYEYRVENYTEHVTASDTVQVTTTAGAPQDTTPERSGWYVELTASDGSTRTFTSDGDPERDPSLKDLERVTVTVGKDESWDASKWEDASARVWQNGYRLPVDTLVSRNQRPGQTQLVIEGPAELHETNEYEFSNTDVHDAVDTVLGDTSIPHTVVSPGVTENQLFDTVDTQAKLDAYHSNPDNELPAGATANGLALLQTCWFTEGEAHGTTVDAANSNHSYTPDWSGDGAYDCAPDDLDFSFTPQYDIPDGEFGLYFRLNPHEFGGDFEVVVNGQTVRSQSFPFDDPETPQDESTTYDSANWEDALFSDYSGRIEAGTQVTINFRVPSGFDGQFYIDCVAPFDRRYHTGPFDSSTTNGYLDTPALYPTGGIDAVFIHNGYQSSSGARVEATFNDTTGDQAIALSPDYGNSYPASASNTDTIETDFAAPAPDVTFRATLDAYGATRDTATPRENYQGQILEEYTLETDVRDSPALSNADLSGDYVEILTQLVNRGNILWAAEWENQQIEIRVASVSDLTSARDLDLVDYEWDTQTLGKQITWATIDGGSQPVLSETINATVPQGNSLVHEGLILGSESVRDSATGTTYERGADYTMNYVLGNINPVTGGRLSDGQQLVIDYEWKPDGEYAAGVATEKKRLRDQFVGASTDSICKAIAYYLVQKLKDPVIGGTATVDAVPPAMSLLDVFAADPVPSDVTDSFYVQSGSVTEGQATFTIESRRPRGELIGQINSALGDVQDRV